MTNMAEGAKKILMSVLPAVVASYFGALAIPMILLFMANIIDYITGIMAAPYRGQDRQSAKGWRGIAKKICMWLLVVVGVLMDAVLAYAANTFGWQLPFSFAVACIVCLWQLANELISVLENINDMGVSVPTWMKKLIGWVKNKTEDSLPKVGTEESEEREDGMA